MKYEYLKNTPIEAALSEYLSHLKKVGVHYKTEEMPVKNAKGRLTASAQYAKRCSPHYCASAMDGVALLSEKTAGASENTPVLLHENEYVRVDTGDALPIGTDAVVMIENVTACENGDILLHEAVPPWNHVRQIGEDVSMGDMIVPSFTEITPSVIGALLAGGIFKVEVIKRPKVAIIPTGDEIVACDSEPGEGEIPEYNSAVFSAMLDDFGADSTVFPIVPDKIELIKDTVKKASGKCDMVLVIAGSSAGRDDYTQTVLSSLGTVLFHGLAIRPGKPAILGNIGDIPFVGVPGYPVSGIIVVNEIVKPVISLLSHREIKKEEEIPVFLSKRLTSSLKYKEYVRATAAWVNGRMIAVPMNRGAGIVTGFSKASGIIEIDQNSEGFEQGEEAVMKLLKPKKMIFGGVSVIGSHDPLIDEIADILVRHDNPTCVLSSHVGSMGAIMALRNKEAHLGGIHLLSPETGRYNIDYIKKYFKKGEVTLIKGVIREQGIMTKKGNPENIKAVSDLTRISYVNRQKGAGTRILLDWLLAKYGINPNEIYGYSREEYTHTAVAAAIASNSADAGMGIFSAAKTYGLDFVNLWDEEYDFLVSTEALNTNEVKSFVEALKSDELKLRLKKMGGYKCENTGTVVPAEEIWS